MQRAPSADCVRMKGRPSRVLIRTSHDLYARPATLPFDHGWGLGDRWLLCFVLAAAVLLGPLVRGWSVRPWETPMPSNPPLGYWHGFPVRATPSALVLYPLFGYLDTFQALDDSLA